MNKRVLSSLIVAATILSVGSIRMFAGDDDGPDQAKAERNRIRIGFEIAPVPLDIRIKNAKNLNAVGLGSYLVNGPGGCNDCHTQPSFAPGGNPFMGEHKKINAENYLAGGQPFGPVVSRNLTPENGLPAGRTFEEFKNILRTGIDYDHAHPQFGPLLQVMPWPSYQNLTDHDILAIYEYLKAIPHAEPGVATTTP
jgi:hypothetical protein